MLISLLMSDMELKYKVIYLLIDLIVIIVSLSIHEWGHAFAAHKNGDDTAKNLGRMTLNPVAHIDPTGLLMLVVVGFGWAKPVPVNPRNYRNYRRGEFIVSFAGIFMNLILALIAALAVTIVAVFDCKAYGVPATAENIRLLATLKGTAEYSAVFYMFLYMLGITNCALAVFNLLPVYPLDGSHIFDLVFGRLLGAKALMWMHKNGRFILIGFLVVSMFLSRALGISIIGGAAEWIYGRFVALFSLGAGLIA